MSEPRRSGKAAGKAAGPRPGTAKRANMGSGRASGAAAHAQGSGETLPRAEGKDVRPAIKPRGGRRQRGAATREVILAAALDEFSARGFAAARLDDVARRAGVAKGTIYVHFRDKETLFEELVRSYLGSVVGLLAAPADEDLPVRAFVERLIDTFVREVLGTRRKDVLRLVVTEGARFPELAHVHYREVINRALPLVRERLQRAHARGELPNDALVRFPQLLVAPALLVVIWDALFSRYEALDAAALMRAHLDLLFGERGGR